MKMGACEAVLSSSKSITKLQERNDFAEVFLPEEWSFAFMLIKIASELLNRQVDCLPNDLW